MRRPLEQVDWHAAGWPHVAVTRRHLRAFVFVAGPLVLVSYVVGIARADDPEALWGGITGAARAATIPFMFVAAAGFLAYAWVILFRLDDEQLAGLHWPWAAPDGRGAQRALTSYALYLIPSALWLEATLLHLNDPRAWTPTLVVGVLFLVSVGLVMLGLLGWSAHRERVPRARWMVLGAIGMGIQSIVNDLIIWVIEFPW